MADIEKVKEEIKKNLAIPPEAHVEKLFEKLDPQKTGFISVDAFLKVCEEMGKKHEGLPKDPHEEEHKKKFKELVEKNQTQGKMSKAQATTLFTALLNGIKEHLEHECHC
ncbi:MAG: hypothetical protein MJ252_05610 [archaeon]|nr:hypothetical protein [archaeon]